MVGLEIKSEAQRVQSSMFRWLVDALVGWLVTPHAWRQSQSSMFRLAGTPDGGGRNPFKGMLLPVPGPQHPRAPQTNTFRLPYQAISNLAR